MTYHGQNKRGHLANYWVINRSYSAEPDKTASDFSIVQSEGISIVEFLLYHDFSKDSSSNHLAARYFSLNYSYASFVRVFQASTEAFAFSYVL